MDRFVKKVALINFLKTTTALAQTSWKAFLFKNLFFHGAKERPAEAPFVAMKKRFLKESL